MIYLLHVCAKNDNASFTPGTSPWHLHPQKHLYSCPRYNTCITQRGDLPPSKRGKKNQAKNVWYLSRIHAICHVRTKLKTLLSKGISFSGGSICSLLYARGLWWYNPHTPGRRIYKRSWHTLWSGMILYVPNRVGVLFHGFYHDPENIFFCFNYSCVCKVKTASLARVHDEAKSFNLFLVKSHLLWLPFQIKKSCMIWKIDGISFLNSRPDVEVHTKPREVKRSLKETLRRPRCRICVCASFEGFWTRFVMDRCREHLLRLWIDPTMPWCLLY